MKLGRYLRIGTVAGLDIFPAGPLGQDRSQHIGDLLKVLFRIRLLAADALYLFVDSPPRRVNEDVALQDHGKTVRDVPDEGRVDAFIPCQPQDMTLQLGDPAGKLFIEIGTERVGR